jgi:ATP-dependent DNA helicase PIF1
MDEDQKKAIDLAISSKSLFLTGAGGTGKSYVVRKIIEELERNGKDVALTAMTGCATILLGKNAKTLHSWAGIGLGKETVSALLAKIKKSSKSKKNWLIIDTLIIDEVSMMSPDLLDKLDYIARNIRKSDTLFGGIQLILVGDLYQLPPINRDSRDGPQFVFESSTWKHLEDTITLRTIHRQSDATFVKILQEARIGELSEESIDILEKRKTSEWKKLEIKPTLIFSRRDDVEQINVTQLRKCEGPDIVFKARTIRQRGLVTENEQYAIDKMDKVGSYVPELTLRKGAQVMLLTNKYASEYGLVNGSRGIVEKFCEGPEPLPMVKFKNGQVIIVAFHAWNSEEVVGLQREQIPLQLAYAVTIHKAQGATLDCALIDIGKNTFENGQAYVALSRVKSLDCLYIWDFDPEAFTVHPKVRDYHKGKL